MGRLECCFSPIISPEKSVGFTPTLIMISSYIFGRVLMDDMTSDELTAALNHLMEIGIVEMSWDDEKNDFVFSLTAEGLRIATDGNLELD